MPDAVLDGERPFHPGVHLCAVVLCRTEHGNLHLGLLHQAMNGEAAVLHLGWRDSLSMSWPWMRLWVCPDAGPEKLMTAAVHCQRIWWRFQKDGTLPYALGDFESRFDERGCLVLAPGSMGLTCATFAMAVFREAGVELVQKEGWPVRVEQDLQWLVGVARFAEPDHLAMLREQVEAGVARVHPHELLAACTLTPLPVPFSRVPPVAEAVVAKIDAAIGR